MATRHAVSANDAGDRGPGILGAIISTYCVSIVAICLRATARRISKAKFWIDDWLIFVGTVIHTANYTYYIHILTAFPDPLYCNIGGVYRR